MTIEQAVTKAKEYKLDPKHSQKNLWEIVELIVSAWHGVAMLVKEPCDCRKCQPKLWK